MTIKVAISNDHGGVALKNYLIENFKAVPVEWVNLGTDSSDSVDYPDYGFKLADAVTKGEADLGIAICGSGIGISMACNRNPAVRAALCTDTTMAHLSREHNNANILCLGARLTGDVLAMEIVESFLTAKFEGGRHATRVDKLGQC